MRPFILDPFTVSDFSAFYRHHDLLEFKDFLYLKIMSLLSNYNNFEIVIGAVKYIIYYNCLVLHGYKIFKLPVMYVVPL